MKPTCKLIGEDGNVFNIIGLVRRALRQAGDLEGAAEFKRRALLAHSYDEVLQLAMEYVEVM
jgi:hypothetical protein